METFDTGCAVDGYATEEEFINHYANISAFVDSDTEFEAIARHVWRDTSRPGGVRGRAGSRVNRQVTYKSTLSENQSAHSNNGYSGGGFANKRRGSMTTAQESLISKSAESPESVAAQKAPIELPDGIGILPTLTV